MRSAPRTSLALGRSVRFLTTSPRLPVHRSLRHFSLGALLLTACHHGKPEDPASAPIEPPARPLALLAAQRVILVPAFSLVTGDVMGWGAQIPKSREYLKSLDDELQTALSERG